MFAPSKFKRSGGPNANKSTNSRNQFVAELNANGTNVFNRSFDTVQKLLQGNDKNLKQTKLCLPRPMVELVKKEPDAAMVSSSAFFKKDAKPPEFFLMPVPKPKAKHQTTEHKANKKKTFMQPCELHHEAEDQQSKAIESKAIESQSSNLLAKNGRSMVALVGQVDFCLKMHKVHPELSALWDVYGKLLKIIKGKQRGEHVILLRNSSSCGPILQSVYYDFNNTLQQFEIGSSVRAVGRFVENRLQTFKLQQIDVEIAQQHFTRIQNVTSFVLLQNNIQTSDVK